MKVKVTVVTEFLKSDWSIRSKMIKIRNSTVLTFTFQVCMVFVSLRYHWDLLESSCHNFCTLLFAFCNKIQFLFDMVVYLLTYPILTFNTNPLIARCLSALCRRSWGKDYSRAAPPPPPFTFWCGNYHNRCVWVNLHFQSSGRGGAPSRFPNSGW